MLRKYLFWGLTLVLVVALVNLVIRSRRMEKKRAGQLVETVEEAKPTATRVLDPPDLRIVQAGMQPGDVPRGTAPARQEVEIFNGGNVAYTAIQLKITYHGSSGKRLGTTGYSIAQSIQPGATIRLESIPVADIPPDAAKSEIAISYADIVPGAPQKQKGQGAE